MVQNHTCCAGEQVAQWDFQNNATRTTPPGPARVLESCSIQLIQNVKMWFLYLLLSPVVCLGLFSKTSLLEKLRNKNVMSSSSKKVVDNVKTKSDRTSVSFHEYFQVFSTFGVARNDFF